MSIVGIHTQLRNLKMIKASAMIKTTSAIFKTFFLSLCIVANTHFAYGQTASILPQGYTQYLDNNGKPLAAGKVYNYIPNTTTLKTTWQDAAETIPNTNPVILDAGGRAKILGDGNYRQIVRDRNNVLIWDANTSSTGSSSGGPTATGDGDLVGTIKPWAGLTAPNQYQFAYGQEVSRTTFSALYTAITSSQATFCSSGSPTITGLADTTNFWVGMAVELSCVAAGWSTVVSKTAASVTLAANANVSTNTTAIFYPWGRGNGSTTFNLPDLRGVVPAGNNNMGGVASPNLTTTYFGSTNPNSVGALGGSESITLDPSKVPSVNTVNTGTGAVSTTSAVDYAKANGGGLLTTNTPPGGVGLILGNSASIGAVTATGTVTLGTLQGVTTSGGTAGGGQLVTGGSGYTNGSQVLTIAGGTCTTPPQFTATVVANVVTAVSLLTAGNCVSPPNNPAATTGGGGTGATITVGYLALPFSRVQPTRTTNYIVKVTPDTNSATASGVTSLGGMTGDIACGTYLLCTGNTISVNIPPINDADIVYVESCGAVGDGVTDDAPAIRTCNDQVAAQTNGGTLGLSCNKTYLLASLASGSFSTIIRPKSNVSIHGCGDSSVLKVANNMNTASTTYFVFYPASNTVADRVDNAGFYNFKIDNNGVNNRGTGGGTLYYNNVNIGIVHGKNLVIDGVTFANNPGSQNIAINGTQGAATIVGVTIRNTKHLDSCDIINAACTDHSSMFVFADSVTATNNHCIYSSQSTKSTCWEQWGSGGTFDSNTANNYFKMANIASIVYGISTRDQVMSNNTGINLGTGYTLWCDGVSSSRLRDVTITGNSFRQSVQVGSISFFDFNSGITADCATNLRHVNNTFRSDVAGGTAGTTPALLLGRAYGQAVIGGSFTNGLGPAIGNSTFSSATSFEITGVMITDAGQTSTAAGRRGILINSATPILQARVSNNTVLNVASTYMTTCIDVTATVTTSQTSWVSIFQPVNCATPSALTLTNFATISPSGIPYYQNAVGPLGSTNALQGAVLNTDPVSFAPILSVTPTVGVAGSVVGQWCMRNATSGSACISPATGALGTTVATVPIGTYNIVGDTLTQTLTNKTLGATTLSGTISGGNNTIDNVVIGTTTNPRAAIFTEVQTRGTANLGVSINNNSGTNQVFFRWNSTLGGYFGMSNVAGSVTAQLYGEGVQDQYFAPTGAGAAFGFNTTTPTTAQSGTIIGLVSNGGIKTSSIAVASLPTCNAAAIGARFTVNNATATTFASTVAGGGANIVPVMCNGSNWIIG